MCLRAWAQKCVCVCVCESVPAATLHVSQCHVAPHFSHSAKHETVIFFDSEYFNAKRLKYVRIFFRFSTESQALECM